VTSVNDKVITESVAAATSRSVTVPGATGVRAVPLATFESGPNTAFTISVPRYDTSSKSYAVPVVRPSTVQVRFAPMTMPGKGVAHVPRLTLDAVPPHTSGVGATRMS
jgi:hypothetical protein